MMREYRVKQREDWSRNLQLDELMDVADNRVEPGFGPYQVWQGGEWTTNKLIRVEALKKFRHQISNREIGDVFKIVDIREPQIVARAVQAFSDADTTSGNAKADRFWNWIRQEFEPWEPRYAGAYVCKVLSQHRFGNAVDVFFDTLAHQDLVAHRVVALAEFLHPMHVISKQRIWTKGVGWHDHTGDFHGHLHVDFDPNWVSSLACGVRG